jgi:hypothetical protein
VTVVAFQNRYLLRPSPEVNDLFVGVLGRAQRLYGMRVCSVAAMSTHWHALLVPRDAEHMADFMEHVDCNLSKEIGTRLHGWPGAMWNDRYHHVPVADRRHRPSGVPIASCRAWSSSRRWSSTRTRSTQALVCCWS